MNKMQTEPDDDAVASLRKEIFDFLPGDEFLNHSKLFVIAKRYLDTDAQTYGPSIDEIVAWNLYEAWKNGR